MSLSLQDAQAIAGTAQRLGVDPRTLGALMEMESGLDPNIWGGAGGQYRGLIQFGPGARKEVGLPDRKMSIAEQMPFVEKYFQQRGFTPGKHGTTELYRTVLVGNPRQSGTDSFGTNSDAAAKRMMPGGDLYQRFSGKFDPVSKKADSSGAVPVLPAPAANSGSDIEASLLKQIMGGGGSGFGLPGLEVPGLADIGKMGGATRFAGLAAPLIAALPMLYAQDPAAAQMAKQGLVNAAADEALVGIHRRAAEASMPQIPQLEEAGAGSRSAMDLAAMGMSDAPAGEGGSSAGGQRMAASGPMLGLVDIGKRLQGAGLRVKEHPAFGGVGGHSPGSLHYKGLALDLTDWQDPGESEKSWLPRKKFLGQQFEQILGPQGEIFHPGNDPKGHGSHIHFGIPTGKLSEGQVNALVQARQEALKRFPLRWAG